MILISRYLEIVYYLSSIDFQSQRSFVLGLRINEPKTIPFPRLDERVKGFQVCIGISSRYISSREMEASP
jgi:hypothetical protein